MTCAAFARVSSCSPRAGSQLGRGTRETASKLAGYTGALVLTLLSPLAQARTIELSDIDADLIACIRPECPRMSFAGYQIAPGVFTSDYIGLRHGVSMMIRVPLDKIPKGMRITKAEWIIHV